MDTLQDGKMRYYWDRVRHHGARYAKFHWPSVEVILNLVYTYDVALNHFAKRMSKIGLSPSAFNVLMILSRHDEKSCKQRDLSKLMLVSRANITGLVDSLAKRGLISRAPDKTDRRVCIVRMAKKGERLLEQFLPSHYEEMRRILSNLTPAEEKTLTALLSKLRSLFWQQKKEGRP
ncbi:MAG TPA: MarR family transcriptional regulator [Candidatus Omnitrophota bacterium]|mgnify:CR=1 FL=1|nr:MarR family transcriptional regulator [Candidatus Omnitrophota bacterium]